MLLPQAPGPWHWLALAGALVIIEAFVPGCMLLWLGVGAALVGLTLLVGPAQDLPVQLLLFAAFSLLGVLAWRRYQHRFPAFSEQPALNRRAAQYVGRRARLVEAIENGRGRIRLADSSWAVEGQDAPAGQVVEVTGVRGIVLEVRPLPAEEAAARVAQLHPPG